MTKTYEEKKAHQEIEKTARNLSVFIIMRNSNTEGKITIRVRGNSVCYAIVMGYRIAHYKRARNTCSNNDLLIGELLEDKARLLHEEYGINLGNNPSWIIQKIWKHSFEVAGFQVVQAI